MTPRSCLVAALVWLALPVGAQTGGADPAVQTEPQMAARVAAFSDSLMIGRVMEVMRDEGLDYGQSLQDDLFPGTASDRWQAAIARIYDAKAMRAAFGAAMQRELGGDPAALADMEAFFGNERGQRILTLEIEARASLRDDAVEEAASVAAERLTAAKDPIVAQIRRFAEAGDLIEMNVAGALTSNLAFYKGMAAEGAFEQAMTEPEMLAEVWAQEPDIRTETEDWLLPYLALAYQPLEPGDLDAYIAFVESPSGRRLNSAMFAAFDAVFTEISHQLGRAAARQMKGDDI